VSTYILYVDKNSNISEDVLLDIEKKHETEQDSVVRVYTDRTLPYGFAVVKDDNLLNDVAKAKPEILNEKKVLNKIQKQHEFLKEQAKFSRDQTLLKGVKPYGKN